MASQTFPLGAGVYDGIDSYGGTIVWDLSAAPLAVDAALLEYGGSAHLEWVGIPGGDQPNSFYIGIRGPTDGRGSFTDVDLTPAWESYAEAIIVDAPGLSPLKIQGPAHADAAVADTAEPYSWRLSGAADEARSLAWVLAWAALSDADKARTTVTLRDSAPPAAVLQATAAATGAAAGALAVLASLAAAPRIMIQQVIILGDTPDGLFQTFAEGFASWTLADAQLDAGFTGSVTPEFVRIFRLAGNSEQRQQILTSSSGDAYVRGQDLVAGWETAETAILVRAGGLSLRLAGPDHSSATHQDADNPYSWRVPQAKALEIRSFVTSWPGLSDAERAAATLTLSRPGATAKATAPFAGASAGALAVLASLAAAPLALTDFDRAGRSVDVLGIFVAAAPATIYADSNRGGTQSPLAGSDFGIGAGETIISRIKVGGAGATITLNDDDRPTSLLMSAHFGAAFAKSRWTLYVQTLAGVASTNQITSIGGSFSNWAFHASNRAIIDAIGAGDRVILAIATEGALDATAIFAGASAGALTSVASLQAPPALDATAIFAGASAGALTSVASLQAPPALDATAIFAGASAGALASTARIAAVQRPAAISRIRAAEQALSLPAIVELIEIDARRLGAGRARITPGSRGGAAVSYGGLTYEPLPLRISDVRRGGRSAAEPVLEIGRAGRDILSLLASADNLVGAKVVRIRTLETFLDGAADADAAQHWPPETWVIDQLLALDTGDLSLKWQLASPLTLDSLYLPTRQVLRDVCAWRYRRWDADAVPPAWDYSDAECPYRGSDNFDDADAALPPGKAGAPRDVCSRRISGCKLRFSGALPIAAFPGVRLGS